MEVSNSKYNLRNSPSQILGNWSTYENVALRGNLTVLPHLEEQSVFVPTDVKAARMMDIHAKQSYKRSIELSQMRMKKLSWFLKNKITERTKRMLDLIFCIAALPFVLPVMLLTAIAIKLDSPGPVFFKQERVGKWGRKFSCYKFRSMCVDAEKLKQELAALNEADGVVFKMKNDPRITRVGRVIRKLSIDELPQFFNILKGDMSLVGPRPPVMIEVEQYQFDHFRRLDAVPGLTGLQQISGRSTLPFARWVELDVQYIEEQSLKKDIEIILKTIPAVITGKGAY